MIMSHIIQIHSNLNELFCSVHTLFNFDKKNNKVSYKQTVLKKNKTRLHPTTPIFLEKQLKPSHCWNGGL